jgi:hypothetical protein
MTKKAKAKSDGPEKKSKTRASTTTTSPQQKAPPIDLAEVRKDISNIVGLRAAELAKAVLEEGKKGQLAPVKYLFEVSGLYPASESSETKPDEESLAHTLMRKLNLPELPIESEDDEAAGSGIEGSSSPEEYGKKNAARNGDSETGAGAGSSNGEIS